jgi:hypothetical protein
MFHDRSQKIIGNRMVNASPVRVSLTHARLIERSWYTANSHAFAGLNTPAGNSSTAPVQPVPAQYSQVTLQRNRLCIQIQVRCIIGPARCTRKERSTAGQQRTVTPSNSSATAEVLDQPELIQRLGHRLGQGRDGGRAQPCVRAHRAGLCEISTGHTHCLES